MWRGRSVLRLAWLPRAQPGTKVERTLRDETRAFIMSIGRHAMALWLAGTFVLAGCALLGPGASGDDDEDSDTDGDSSGGSNRAIGYVPPINSSAGTGASGTGSPGREATYNCTETGSTCSCYTPSAASQRCKLDWACCLLDEDTRSCECTDEAACVALAESRPGSSVIATCPPNADSLPIACADAGENCSSEYLQAERLDGCCEGLVCKPNEAGIRTCAQGTADEIELAKQCIDQRVPELLTLEAPLMASVQDTAVELPFTVTSTLTRIQLDAAGAIETVTLELTPSADLVSASTCALVLIAGPKNAEGAWPVSVQLRALSPLIGAMTSCVPGLGSGLFTGANIGMLSFVGASCELSFETCFAGDFLLRLDGIVGTDVAVSGTPEALVFDGEEARLTGRLCGF